MCCAELGLAGGLLLRVPERRDFVMRQAWLADPDFMSYNVGWSVDSPGYDPVTGCIDWLESQWDAFEVGLCQPLSERGYFFVVDGCTGVPIGHVHYAVDGDVAAIGFNVIPARRGEGLGAAFLGLLLERVRWETRATEVVNEFEDGRVAALRVHQDAGFRPDPGTSSAYGRPVRTWRLNLTI